MIFRLQKLSEIIRQELKTNEKLQEGFLRVHWESLVGKYSKYSEITYLYDGILSISIKNSMALQHMYMNKNSILIQLNEKLREKEFQILDIRWTLEGKYE